MSDENTIWADVLRAIAASGVVSAAGWGAMGGATSALAVGGTSRRAVVRYVTLGAIVAGGTGSLAVALLSKVVGFDASLIPLAGAGSSASFFVGVFGPAVIEVVLSRIRAGRLPGEEKDDG